MNEVAIEYLHQVVVSSATFYEEIPNIVKALDQKLSEQINEILHHEEFQKLEGSWRGFYYLVSNTKTDDQLKIKYFDISKMELNKHCEKHRGESWSQSRLFKKLHDDIYGVSFEEPFGCLVGDYYFDHTPSDIETLSQMAKIAKAIHAPFITAPAPKILHETVDSWQEWISSSVDIDLVFNRPEFTSWNALRESDDARYLGMAMPRCLARSPYGTKNKPVAEFSFEESTEEGNYKSFCWMNAAYMMACNFNRAFSHYGWCSHISGLEQGGKRKNLLFSNDLKEKNLCPLDASFHNKYEMKLASIGFLPLLHSKDFKSVVFISGRSLHKPFEYDDFELKCNAILTARFNYLFPFCRFAHYVRCILRDRISLEKNSQSQEDIECYLNGWIQHYVDPSAYSHSDSEYMINKPLARAKVLVQKVEKNSELYTFQLSLLPQYQLDEDGITEDMSVIFNMVI